MIKTLRVRSIDRRGYAMAMFLVVMTLLTTMTLVVMAAVSTDLTSSHNDVALAQARALAETGLEGFDSQVMENTDTTLDPILQNKALPAATAALLGYHQWVTYQPAPGPGTVNRSAGATLGTAQPCTHTVNGQTVDDYTRDCFYVDVAPASTTTTIGGVKTTSTTPMVLVSVISRARCGGTQVHCTYAAVQERLRNRQLFDFLFYTQFDSLDPALYPLTPSQPGQLSQAQAYQYCAERYATRPNDPSTIDATTASTLTAHGVDLSAPLAGRDAELTAGKIPAPCVEVAYEADPQVNGDTIGGPVFTNDDRIAVCGHPQFNPDGASDAVIVAGDGANGTYWKSMYDINSADTGCANSEPRNADDTAIAPGRPCLRTCALQLPDAGGVDKAFAAATASTYQITPPAGTSAVISFSAPTVAGGQSQLSVTLGSGKTATTTTMALPPNGLLYINGDATLSSATKTSILAGKLSVFVTGTLTVAGDVRYCGHTPGAAGICDASSSSALTGTSAFQSRAAMLSGTDNSHQPDTDDLLVLMDMHGIQLAQPLACGTAGADPANCGLGAQRELDAVLIALGNAVSVQNWDTVQPWATGNDPSSTPLLHFYGAMAARYQGVFGSYGAVTGAITSGYHKDFAFDDRLRQNELSLPYYPLSPGESNWVRVDTTDVAPKLVCTQVAQAAHVPLSCP